MADELKYNLSNDGQKAERRLQADYVNVGTHEKPEWELQGYGVEESALEYNSEVNTVTDITGNTETTVDSMAPQRSMEPNTVRKGSKLHLKLIDIIRRKAWSELSLFEILHVRGYIGEEGKLDAELHRNCTIEPVSEGGSGTVDMPINMYYSNDKVLGTVDKISKSPTFTPNEGQE